LGKPKYKNSVLLLPCSLSSGEAAASYLVVYRFEDRLPGDYNNPESILKLVRLNGYSTITIEDNTAVEGKTYCYVVSAVNRAHTESDLSDWRTIEVRSKGRIRLLKKDK
jgi:fibronectin type 3 domain-containing protein